MENLFYLSTLELHQVAKQLQARVEEGLKAENQEILAIPTYLHPKEEMADERVLAIDWGGTNFRAAIVAYEGGRITVIEENKNRLSYLETKGFTMSRLFQTMGDYIAQLTHLDSSVTKIGFCFSYPAQSQLNGDAVLVRWTKGIDIPDMIGQQIGENLIKHLNRRKDIHTTFASVKVINDTVACLMAGIAERTLEGKPYDGYMGLIVGTGLNMAALMPAHKIAKLKRNTTNLLPVNLESGNFTPPHLLFIDDLVDAISSNKGSQRFEKAVSGGYLGEIFKALFMNEKIKRDFDAKDITTLLNYPERYKIEHVDAAHWIYYRSAKLTAAKLAGMAHVLKAQNSHLHSLFLAADGSLFWSNNYSEIVEDTLDLLLPDGVEITLSLRENMVKPNLIGSAMAALS